MVCVPRGKYAFELTTPTGDVDERECTDFLLAHIEPGMRALKHTDARLHTRLLAELGRQ